jgi:protein SCO1/2
MNRAALVLIVWALCRGIASAAVVPTAPPQTEWHQHLGAALPAALRLVDAQGRAVRLGDYFEGVPLVLVLGYHRCPNLCGLLMHGVLEALAGSGLPRSAYRVVVVSIDPDESAGDARARREVDLHYAAFLADGRATAPLRLQRLVGRAPDVQALAQRVGFDHQRDASSGDVASRYVHPSGFVVVTPQGRIARYFFGVRFDATELRRALDDAAAGRTGTLTDRLLLLCAHFDPRLGRHDAAVMWMLRTIGLALALGLVLYAWRRRDGIARR